MTYTTTENPFDDLGYLSDILTEYAGVHPDVIRYVTAINGENRATYEEILYIATGCKEFGDYLND